MKSIAVLGSGVGVGTTSLVYHLAWMYAKLDYNVLVADLDPQADLTGMFPGRRCAGGAVGGRSRRRHNLHVAAALLDGTGDVAMPRVTEPVPGIGLVAGDILLSGAEDALSRQWSEGLDGKPRAFRVLSGIQRILRSAADCVAADLVLVDAARTSAPSSGRCWSAPTMWSWRLRPTSAPYGGSATSGRRCTGGEGSGRSAGNAGPPADLDLPRGDMRPIGYVVLRHAVRLTRPYMAYERWMDRVPSAYGDLVAGESTASSVAAEDDPHCLASLGHFRSLMPLAREARKPLFALKPADGALGGHANAVRDCYRDFRALARAVAQRCGVTAG